MLCRCVSPHGGNSLADRDDENKWLERAAVPEVFTEVWCEIFCVHHHPCGLRKLFLSTQGHCFSERRGENAGVLSKSEMETSDKIIQVGLFGIMPPFIVRVWISLFFYYK